MSNMNQSVNVLGKVVLTSEVLRQPCLCDDCGCQLNDSWGDPRIKVSTFDSPTAKVPSAVRWVCESCVDELFGDSEPSSIFG